MAASLLISHLFVSPPVAIGWDAGGRVPSTAHAAAAGIGAAKCLSEQNKDAHRHTTRERGQRPGAEGVYTESSSWAEGERNWVNISDECFMMALF